MARRYKMVTCSRFSLAVVIAVGLMIVGGLSLAGTAPGENFGILPDQIPPEMKAMCAKDGGAHVYKRALGVDGYAVLPEEDAPTVDEIARGDVTNAALAGGCLLCFEELIKDKYRFIETYYVQATDRDRDKYILGNRDYDLTETGLYRYQIVEKTFNKKCSSFNKIAKEAESVYGKPPLDVDPRLGLFARYLREYADAMHGKCIYAARISHFTARYRLRLHREIWTASDRSERSGKIYRLRNSVEASNGEVMAEAIFYSYIVDGQMMAQKSLSCGAAILPPITEILQPSSHEQTK